MDDTNVLDIAQTMLSALQERYGDMPIPLVSLALAATIVVDVHAL